MITTFKSTLSILHENIRRYFELLASIITEMCWRVVFMGLPGLTLLLLSVKEQ